LFCPRKNYEENPREIPWKKENFRDIYDASKLFTTSGMTLFSVLGEALDGFSEFLSTEI
jgi:hypothetical protein